MKETVKLLRQHPQQLRLLLYAAGALLRVGLIIFGEWQDRNMKVKFTDVDYKVYTDAAEHVLKGRSPYDRHTYRYSPVVAYLCLPNLLGYPFFGKLVFCCMDIAVALIIEESLWRLHRERKQHQLPAGSMAREPLSCSLQLANAGTLGDGKGMTRSIKRSSKSTSSNGSTKTDEYPLHTFLLPCCCWLFHPVVAAVSARGNADAFPCLLVLLTVSTLRRGWILLSAVLYGLSVHVKLYPVIYGLPILLYLQKEKLPENLTSLPARPQGMVQQLVWAVFFAPAAAVILPVRACWFLLRKMGLWQWLFGVTSVMVFFVVGLMCYRAYGFPFVFESYLYHATRSDHRHNFSLFFYLLYLDSAAPLKGLSVALLVPQLICSLLVGFFFARTHLEAGLFLQTVVFVALNKVCTSQYFLWWLCLLPFAIASMDMETITLWKTLAAMVGFQLSNLLWLFFGYRLEYEGKPVFLELMLSAVVFVAAQLGLVVFFSLKIRAKDASHLARMQNKKRA